MTALLNTFNSKKILIFASIVFLILGCTTYNDVKYFRKDIPSKNMEEGKFIKLSSKAFSRIEGLINMEKMEHEMGSRYTVPVAGFKQSSNSDFRIDWVDAPLDSIADDRKNKECGNFWIITAITIGIIPTFDRCGHKEIITSYYKGEKRLEFSYERRVTRYSHLLLIWGEWIPPSENEKDEPEVFRLQALTKIYNDFKKLQEGTDEKQLDEESESITVMAKSLNIRVDQILDLRNESNRNDFLLSWYNSKENPGIENNMGYKESEFQYQKDKKIFQEWRAYKYALTDTYLRWGEYNFTAKDYNISPHTGAFLYSTEVKGDSFGTVSRLLELKNPLMENQAIKYSIGFKISPDKAESFKTFKYERKNVLMLSKFSPAYHTSTGYCQYPDKYYEIRDTEYKECKKRFENRALKFKYLSIEPVKYRIIYDGEVYKNY